MKTEESTVVTAEVVVVKNDSNDLTLFYLWFIQTFLYIPAIYLLIITSWSLLPIPPTDSRFIGNTPGLLMQALLNYGM